MEIELNGADETASTEANAAKAANDGDTSEEDLLIDYNERMKKKPRRRRLNEKH